MIAEATLHAYAHGSLSLKSLLQRWRYARPNSPWRRKRTWQRKAAIEIVPPRLVASTQQKKAAASTAPPPVLMLEAPPLRAPLAVAS
ncbi:hypothetical protein SELMODRAFT_443130 [Selaginella moellendorffii]|uniref:Uncharacterized protein n=1 Tax=Selaginella moellendorffii TaxID=88036 RepID=D8RYU1_SELML|nr:hypothetical protein SELMODRAFT_443130 [Selaginella moellendorffii]